MCGIYPYLTPSLPKSCNFTTSECSDACPNDIHGLPVSGCDIRNSSNSFTLRWWVFSSEVEKFKCFCFDLALKLALYT